MSIIDLGEPDVYEPGEPPILRGYAQLSRSQRRRLYAVAALVVLAGAVGGVAPQAVPAPQVHTVGRVRGPLTQLLGDTVLTYSDQLGDIVAYPLDGEGPRWTVPTDQPPLDIATVDDLFVISFIGLSFRESTTNSQRELPPRVVAVEAATGRPRWQVGGYPMSPLDGPVVAVGDGSVPTQRVVGVDVRDGKELWSRQIAGAPLVRLRDDGIALRRDEVVLLDRDGSVRTMVLADGTTRPAGRVQPGSQGMFEWRGLLGVRVPATDPRPNGQDTFLVYRLGEDRPLWQLRLAPNGGALSPCGEQLCVYDSSGYRRFDPLTGTLVATIAADAPDPYQHDGDPWRPWYAGLVASHWEPIAMYKGRALVRLDPAFTKDMRTWLGEATLDGGEVRVRPLMPIGGRSNYCEVTPDWLFCNGSAVEDAVAVRLTELDRLLGV